MLKYTHVQVELGDALVLLPIAYPVYYPDNYAVINTTKNHVAQIDSGKLTALRTAEIFNEHEKRNNRPACYIVAKAVAFYRHNTLCHTVKDYY